MSELLRSKFASTLAYAGQLVLFAILFFGALANVLFLSIGLGPTSTPNDGPTLSHVQEVLSIGVIKAFSNSLGLAAATSIIAVPLAFLSARFVLAFRSPITRLVVIGIVLLPLLSSSILRMLGYAIILSDSGPLVRLGCWSTGMPACRGLLYSVPANVIGLFSSVFPICVLIFFIQLLRISADEILAAKNLGASPWEVCRRIEIPRCRTAFLISAQMCVILVLGDTLAKSILGGNSLYTYTSAINDRMKVDAWSDAAALAIVLVVIACSIAAAIIWNIQRALPLNVAHPAPPAPRG
jgi:putative spermidine/putrescine transport system permease protein